MSDQVTKLLDFLQIFESSPSAHILVKSIVTGGELSDQEMEDIYNSSEGWNDQHTEQFIRSMTPEQLAELVSTLKSIDEERRQDPEEYEELTEGLDISSMLN